MLIYRVETCISLIGTEKHVQSGLGPYGTRDAMRHELGRRYYTPEQLIEKHEIESWVRNRGLFLFSHEECNMETHPAPTSDKKLMKSFEDKGERPVIRGYNFGFDSVEQLKKWFNQNSRNNLHLQGYYVAIYEVEKAHIGDTQCVFLKDDAKLVNFLSCIEV